MPNYRRKARGKEMIVYDLKSCDYCQSSISTGERWVREKIYNPRSDGQNPDYRHFHAEVFGGQEVSCWEKYWTEREIARTAVTGRNKCNEQGIRLVA
jgi:hypothetical protein